MTRSEPPFELFVACAGARDRAAWAFRLVRGRALIAAGAGAGERTPARAELVAMVAGLRALPDEAWAVRILSTNPAHRVQLAEQVAAPRRAFGKRPRHVDLVGAIRELLHGRAASWVEPSGTHADVRAVRGAAREAARASDRVLDRPALEAVAPTDAALLAYTDGGCRGNPGPGGWGFVLVHAATGSILEARGGAPHTTNNRMELQAAIAALEAIKRPDQQVEIRTDSTYLRDLASAWMPRWKARGWRRADGEPVANLDLVRRLDALCAAHQVRWVQVPAHAGEAGNERADRLANQAMDAQRAGQDPAWSARWPGARAT